MASPRNPGRESRDVRGLWASHRWLVLRRCVQLGVLAAFATGPWIGLWIVKGTLASSMTFDVLPLTDPLMLLQGFVAGHRPEVLSLVGAAIVTVFYALFGGRIYCSWVCPVEPVTALAAWIRRRLGIEKGWQPKPALRLWILGGVLVAGAATGTVVWELVNPITGLYRAILFGAYAGFAGIGAIFLFDLLVARHGWCGHLCPVGAFYGLIGAGGMLRISAAGRARCDDCMDCYAVCPEPHVIAPALGGRRTGAAPLILSADCTACGRCADVCPKTVFRFAHRFDARLEQPATSGPERSAA